MKVTTNEEIIYLYEEQIMESNKRLSKEEHQSRANSKIVAEYIKKNIIFLIPSLVLLKKYYEFIDFN